MKKLSPALWMHKYLFSSEYGYNSAFDRSINFQQFLRFVSFLPKKFFLQKSDARNLGTSAWAGIISCPFTLANNKPTIAVSGGSMITSYDNKPPVNCNIFNAGKIFRSLLGACLLMFAACLTASSQELPPRPISVSVNPAQGLIFGAFFQGTAGGSVIVFPDGSRSVTGDLVQANLGIPFSPAIFEVDANPGTAIAIMNGPDVTLTGSNGGTLSLHIGSASIGSQNNVTQFITTAIPPARTEVRIGGTLTAGNKFNNPAGSYSGSFSVIFIQQ